MRPLVSVITPTIPERAGLLREAVASVRAQTFPEWEHLVLEDVDRQGCAWTCNRLAEQARGDWLFLLADDDLLLPGCLQTHLVHSSEADVVYAPALVWGEDGAQFTTLPPPSIPSTSLIRSQLWRELKGYDEGFARTEDRDFYTRALQYGARFVRVDAGPCWVYRFHGRNKSRQPIGSDR